MNYRESPKLAEHRRQQDSRVRRTMRISVTEGIFSQIYGSLSSIGSGFITKFMVILGASPLQFSLLSALGQVSAVFQPLGVALTYRLRRRKAACIAITAVGRFFTLFLGLALLFPSGSQGIWFLLSLLFISAGLQATGANIWIAWMSDMIPLTLRGRFFSRRSQIMLLAGLVVSYIVSFHVDLFEKTGGLGREYLSFVHLEDWFRVENQALFLGLIFVGATLLSLFGLTVLARQPERPARQKDTRKLREIYLEPFKDKNFRLLMIFGIWWMLSIGVGSAFWGPFMLKKLEMGMFRMQLYGTLHMAASLIAYNFWGRFIDRFGNKTAMKICVVLGGLNPMFWLFMSKDNYSILWFEGLISGFMWAGTAIITTNFVLSIAGKGKEQVYSGLYGAIAGISMMTSTLLSGVFYPSSLDIGIRILEPEQVVFGIGGILRWLTIIPLMAVHEKRVVPLYRALSQVFHYMREMMVYRFKRG